MADTTEDQLLNLSRQLLDAIDGHDRELYAEMCDPSLTAFEPEAAGNLVSGMSFHDFYLQRDPPQPPRRSTISGKDRLKLLDRGFAALRLSIPVNVILFPMEGDPMAASAYWKRVIASRGAFLSPSEDWP